MKEIIIKYPQLELCFYKIDRQGTTFACHKEIKRGKWGYNLAEGQIVDARYRGTNYDFYPRAKIIEIRETGLLILEWLKGETVFAPFEKEFRGSLCKMFISPCCALFEELPISVLVSGELEDKRIWYLHGGWRTAVGRNENLNNFIRIGGQGDLF